MCETHISSPVTYKPSLFGWITHPDRVLYNMAVLTVWAVEGSGECFPSSV